MRKTQVIQFGKPNLKKKESLDDTVSGLALHAIVLLGSEGTAALYAVEL